MGTINDKLNYLNETKTLIKSAIQEKGIEVLDEDTFRSYADKINSISVGNNEEIIFNSSLGNNTSNISSGSKIVVPLGKTKIILILNLATQGMYSINLSGNYQSANKINTDNNGSPYTGVTAGVRFGTFIYEIVSDGKSDTTINLSTSGCIYSRAIAIY